MQKNKLLSIMLTVVLMLTLAVPMVPIWTFGAEVNVEVASVKGTVTVKRAASEKTFNAFAGLKLKQGDVVTTGKSGEVVINIGTDKTIKALVDSSFKISSLSGTDADSKAGFTLIKGTVFNVVSTKQKSSESLTVQTGNTVVGVRGTTYSVSLRGKDGFTVHTLEGSVFLDSVIKRLEEDANASLIHQQTEVGAGEGASANGVYEFSITDLSKDELQYIQDNPGEFSDELVQEAEGQLKSLPETTATDDSGNTQITYPPDPAPSGGGGGSSGSSSGSPGSQATYYGVTFGNDTTGNPASYYSPVAPPIQAPAGQALPTNAFPPAGKVGYTLSGWYDQPNGGNEYSNGVTPITGNVTLYPQFTQDTSQDGLTTTSAFKITAANFPHFRYFATTGSGLAAHYKLTENIDFSRYSGTSYSGWYWEPIGDWQSGSQFTGSFDGDGKTISNFSLMISTSSAGYAGFFGYIGNGGSVSGLKLSGTISHTVDNSGVELCAGGITGYLGSGATIATCSVDVSITGVHSSTTGSSGANVGGIAGDGAGNITQCYSSGSVTARSDNTSVSSTTVYAGGIAGFCSGMSIRNCYSTANVTASVVPSGTANSRAGGIAGVASGGATVQICYYNGGAVSALSNSGSAIAGGITSESNGNVSNCVAYAGSVTASGASSNVGRIFGNASTGVSNYGSTSFTGGSWVANAAGPDGASTAPGDFDSSFWNMMGFNSSNGWNTNNPPTLINTP